MSIRAGLAWYYSLFGVRGVLTMCEHRLFGRPREITARVPHVADPIHIRIDSTDIQIFSDTFVREEYAFDLPFSPKVIVDAGAYIGTTSIYFARKYPNAKVIAIEPEPSNFAVLVRNIRPYPAIVPVRAALWKRDGEISMGHPNPPIEGDGEWGFVAHEGGGSKVRAITMLTLMREMHVPAIDLAKIDIEGAEQEVFQDARWLTGTRCVMIELHDRLRAGCTQAVARTMHAFTHTQRGETTFYVRRT